jgi:transcriptional regulator with XRE-family HTH domain
MRLHRLVQESGSGRALAKASGVSKNAVHLWLQGSEPGRDKLVRLAQATGVSISWLVAGVGEMRPDRPPQGYKLPAVPMPAPGAAAPVDPEPIAFSERYWNYLVELSASRGVPWLLRVKDDAMEPTLRQDDLVIVDATQLDNLRPRSGEPAAALPGGIWFLQGIGFRRIEWRSQGTTWIAIIGCDNPKYGFKKREMQWEALPFLARVIWRAGRI